MIEKSPDVNEMQHLVRRYLHWRASADNQKVETGTRATREA